MIDEDGNEFSVEGFELFRFTGNISEWVMSLGNEVKLTGADAVVEEMKKYT